MASPPPRYSCNSQVFEKRVSFSANHLFERPGYLDADTKTLEKHLATAA